MLKRFSLTALVRILGAGANLVLMLAITWLTGAVEAGIFLFGYSIMTILATVSRLGSELSGLREVAALHDSGTPEQVSRAVRVRIILTTALSISFAGLFALVFAPFAEARFGGDHTSTSIVLLGLGLPALALLGLFTEFLKAVDRATIAVLYQNTTVPGFTVVGLGAAALVQPVGASATAAAMLIATWITLGLAALTFLKWWRTQPIQLGTVERSVVMGDFIQILRDAPALVVVSSTSIIMQWIGSVLLGFLADARHVAGFSVAVRLSITVSIVNSAVISVMSPRMAAAHSAGNIAVLRRLAQQTSLVIMAITAPVLLSIYAFAGFWLSFFGPDFASYAAELRVLVLGQVIAAAIGHSGTVLVMANLYREARFTSIVASLSLVATMLFAIPFFGTLGASAALSFAVVAGHLAGVILTRRNLNFWTVPTEYGDVLYAIRGSS
ncbi:lipopolysaccharide biosynthesis protein [Yoonia vestfoldensis]|uniref:Probable polysaccharide biosynthesis related protein n=1 Tax=Yoonia vestfoldensis SKA53 TaxID=314232 RepID=A3V695_9RHOB|nr:oligosaccharide flippase family protein [Yoonia vestfoldensis]EAQ06419.1 probable polysaccharide biosynthesis related protein [Yoonia vestfoldensis SKA53]